ncbi:hypothetical protein CsSME_00036730 [Camellia sinensis var. sinensis]
MGSEIIAENGLRTRSFRYKDYNNRRVFLRRYPLQWGGKDEEIKKDIVRVHKGGNAKQLSASIFQWGEGRVLVLRRFKHKITFYIIACLPNGFKPPSALITT